MRWTRGCIFLLLIAGSALAETPSGYGIASHKIRLHFFPSESAFSCVDTLTVRFPADHPDRLTLKLLPFYKVSGAFIKGESVEYSLTREGLIISDIPSDTLVDVVVQYSGEMNFRSEFSRMSKSQIFFREEELLPNGGDKILGFVRLHYVLPKGWEGIGIGAIVRRDSTADSTITTWEFEGALPNIGWICAGKFRESTTAAGTIPVTVHLAEAESTSSANIAAIAADVLQYYSEQFTPYRFKTFQVVEVDEWLAGRNVLAIAAPSFIMVKKLAFTTEDKFNRVDAILPHEIAHQWWPGTIFIADEDAAFLSEGLCEYSALLYSEQAGTKTRRDSLANHPLLRSLLMRIQEGRDLPLQQKADLRAMPTHYLKASYVYNMLRRMLGDERFFELLHQYASRFGLKVAGMEDFEQLASEIYGRDMRWFFDQWVKGRGIPKMKIYNVKTARKERGWTTTGRVRMVGYDKYTTLVPVGVTTDSGTKTTMVWLGNDSTNTYRNDAPFEVVTEQKPTKALLDPEGDILKMQPMPPTFSDLREPADGLMIVGNSEYLRSRARIDSAELDRAGWNVSIRSDSGVTLRDLQHERVILYGKADENRIVADLAAKFPYSITDSIRVKSETVFDSTLALLQIIENPFITHGLMLWVAGLTEKAEPLLIPYEDSWVIVRGKEEISSGTWEVENPDGVVVLK